MESNIIRCSKCVTPASYPGASLDEKGVCYYCREYEKIWGNWDDGKELRAQLFGKVLNRARKANSTYDVLVPLSGGKDSTYVLYLATKVYKLKTLAYTFDNGFLTEVAKKNIERAIDASGADHYMFKINPRKIMPVYRHFLKYTSLFCPVCMRGINLARIVLCRQYKIPLILRGTSQRTEEWVTPEIFQNSSLHFFNNVLRKHPIDIDVKNLYLDRNIKEKLCLAVYMLSCKKVLMGVMDAQAPDFFDWDYDEIYKTIVKEFGWQNLADRDEHVDCMIEPLVHYIRRKKVPDLTPNTLRYSAMIRSGMMKRQNALDLVNKEDADSKKLPDEFEDLLSSLNITKDEFETWSQGDFRHMEFQKPTIAMRIFDMARKLTGQSISRK